MFSSFLLADSLFKLVLCCRMKCFSLLEESAVPAKIFVCVEELILAISTVVRRWSTHGERKSFHYEKKRIYFQCEPALWLDSAGCSRIVCRVHSAAMSANIFQHFWTGCWISRLVSSTLQNLEHIQHFCVVWEFQREPKVEQGFLISKDCLLWSNVL